MKDFKVMSEAEDSYHIQHKNGKRFTLDKKGLSPKAHEMIKKMCGGGVTKMSDGGVPPALDPNFVDDSQAPSIGVSNVAPPPTREQMQLDADKKLDDQFTFNKSAPQDSVPVASATPTAVSVVPAGPNPISQSLSDSNSLLNKQQQDINQYTSEIDKAAMGQQAAQQDLINKQAAMKTPQQISDDYKAKDDTLMKQYMDKQIDPNRLFHNASTGSKITAAIGLMLGGIGSGLTGKSNAAIDFMNTAIGHDIDAQKQDQSKAMNLWKMNREHMQDDMQASLATQNQYLSAVQAKVALGASKTQNADAHLRASQMVNQIEQQKIQNRRQLGVLQTAAAGGASSNPGAIVGSLIQNPEDQKSAFKELQENQGVESLRQMWKNSYDDLKDKALHGAAFDRSDRQSAVNIISGKIQKLAEGRYNKDAADNLAEAMLPGHGFTGWEPQETTDKKFIRGNQFFDTERTPSPTLGKYGINPDTLIQGSNPTARMNHQQQIIYNAAIANPNDPNSIPALRKLGVIK